MNVGHIEAMPARILVAEDDLKQAELIRRYLEREGHSTVVVHDGRAAIDEARRRSPDLLVLDVMMPKVDGLDVCRVLRAEARRADHHADRPLHRGRPAARPRPGRRRLPDQAVQPARADGPGPDRAAADPEPVAEGEVYRVGELEIDPVRHEVRLAGQPVE